ncbi:MAG: hypothetical protein AAF292_12385 [Pseudomonadota bacterium]
MLRAPEAYAKRFAKSLDTRKKRRDPAPVVLPLSLPNGMRSPIQKLTGTLALELKSALVGWDSS